MSSARDTRNRRVRKEIPIIRILCALCGPQRSLRSLSNSGWKGTAENLTDFIDQKIAAANFGFVNYADKDLPDLALAPNWSILLPMKRVLATVIFSIFLTLGLTAQDHQHYQLKQPVGFSSVSEAASIARQIVEAAGLKANFMIAEADVPNALAVVQNGKRYILYNPGFVNKLTRATGTRWAAVSILAHEIGHHLYNSFVGKRNIGLATELEADKFSGYVLENMGASLEEAQAAMNVLATPFATSTHPARKDRINSIANGFELAGGIVPEKDAEESAVSPAGAYLARLEFNKNPGKDYFITNSLDIVKVEQRQTAIIGTVSKSTDASFPFILYGSDGYRLYISSGGKIVNARGEIIGKITKA